MHHKRRASSAHVIFYFFTYFLSKYAVKNGFNIQTIHSHLHPNIFYCLSQRFHVCLVTISETCECKTLVCVHEPYWLIYVTFLIESNKKSECVLRLQHVSLMCFIRSNDAVMSKTLSQNQISRFIICNVAPCGSFR